MHDHQTQEGHAIKARSDAGGNKRKQSLQNVTLFHLGQIAMVE